MCPYSHLPYQNDQSKGKFTLVQDRLREKCIIWHKGDLTAKTGEWKHIYD
jgi:hypothetical protein